MLAPAGNAYPEPEARPFESIAQPWADDRNASRLAAMQRSISSQSLNGFVAASLHPD
jgi:hypothetical protein